VRVENIDAVRRSLWLAPIDAHEDRSTGLLYLDTQFFPILDGDSQLESSSLQISGGLVSIWQMSLVPFP
jgi:hypothetical protein